MMKDEVLSLFPSIGVVFVCAGKHIAGRVSPTLAERFRQREKLLAACGKDGLEPLRPHLKGVKQLFVVPTGQMAYIPTDLLTEGIAVRYVPSGSVLARIVESHRVLDGTSLLAVGEQTSTAGHGRVTIWDCKLRHRVADLGDHAGGIRTGSRSVGGKRGLTGLGSAKVGCASFIEREAGGARGAWANGQQNGDDA